MASTGKGALNGSFTFESVLPAGSLEAKHLILVWIMKVKGPKNQANFIEVHI